MEIPKPVKSYKFVNYFRWTNINLYISGMIGLSSKTPCESIVRKCERIYNYKQFKTYMGGFSLTCNPQTTVPKVNDW